MQKKSFTVALTAFVATISAQETYPSIKADIDGVMTDLYVQYPSWSDATISADSTAVSFDFNNKMYLSRSPTLDTSQYFSPDMLGGYLEYDVDLSQVGCGCLTAFYAVMMPAVDNVDDPFQYCGSGSGAKAACPEFDIMEANKYGFRGTDHKCEPSDENGIFSECDNRGQCTIDILEYEDDNYYGPGPDYTIDTTMPFRVRADYQESDDTWTAFTITLTQGDEQVIMSAGDCAYLQGSTYAVKNMTFVLSNWAPQSTAWYQHGACTGSCGDEAVLSTISNLKFSTSGAIDPPKDYETYKYSTRCSGNELNTECATHCTNCFRSWPADDPLKWESEAAACRCLPRQRAPQGYTYGQNNCNSNEQGLCDGCDNCRWSWPSDDPLKWESVESMCRCMPDEQTISYGNNCANAYNGQCGADCQSCHWSWPAGDDDKWASVNADCRCPTSEIKEVVYGGDCNALTYGICGNRCRECRWSWLAEDPDTWSGESATCRCKDWSGAGN